MKNRTLTFAALALAGLALAAGCGGGGGSTNVPLPTTTVPSATATPSSVPAATSVPISAATAQPASVAAGGTTANLTIPAVTSGSGTLTVSGSGSLPSGAVPLLKKRAVNSSLTLIAYVSITPSATVTFSSIPSFSFTLPASISTSGVQFFIAGFAPGATSWTEPLLGPASVSGQTLTFPGVNQPVTIAANQTYGFALYSVPSTSPSGSPSSSPSGNPSSSPSSNPSSSPSSNPSPTAYQFGGASTYINTTSALAMSLTGYPTSNAANVTFTFQGTPTGPGLLYAYDATNNGDVSPNTLPADTANAGSKYVLYFLFVNPGSVDMSFGTTSPALTVQTANGFNGATTCELDAYMRNGGPTFAWGASPITGTISGNTATLPSMIVTGLQIDFKAGQQILAVSCK